MVTRPKSPKRPGKMLLRIWVILPRVVGDVGWEISAAGALYASISTRAAYENRQEYKQEQSAH